ncbi:histone deacetylase 10-like, partial [Diaphorina citri]|uniref:Histone deacetylase 10-like n=1 Tax=Diaphorina citri TaxID=121845 RepID=A0A3Q0JK37_DIACI
MPLLSPTPNSSISKSCTLCIEFLFQYEPDLIIVSAGYDAAIGCLEGEMDITPACYAHLLNSLTGFAQGKVAVILE